MTKRSESGRSIRLAVALALTSSCVPGVHSASESGSGPVGGGNSSPPDVGPSGPSGPPPAFGPVKSSGQPARPIIGGTLVVLPDARTAVAADPDRDHIFVADYRRQTLVADLALQPGDEPGRGVADADGRVHVVLRGGGAVVTLVPNPWRVAARRPVCTAPRGIAYDDSLRQVHVACADGDLVSLPVDPAGVEARRLTLDRDLRDVVVDGDVLLVSRFRSAEVLTVDRSGKILNRQTPGARKTFSPKGVPADGTAGAAGAVPESLMTPSVAWKLVPLRVGETLLLHQRGLDDEVSEQPGGYGGAGCGSIVETTVSRVGPLGSDGASPSLPVGPVAVDLAVSPDRKHLSIVSPGQAKSSLGGNNVMLPGFATGQVAVIDMQTIYQSASECDRGTGPPPGFAPDASFVLPDDAGAPPLETDAGVPADAGADDTSPADAGAPDSMDPDELPPATIDFRQPLGEAVAVAYDRNGHLLVQTREPASIQVLTAENQVVLSLDHRADTGHDIFHSDSGSGIACASCHPEGGDDGRVWKFRNKAGVLEPRRTQNLRGGVMATAPFHWNGDLPTMGQLMDEVFVQRMNGPMLSAEYVQALGKWLDTIPALPKLQVHDAAAVTRGSALFGKSGCTSCHNGNLLTNNTSADVGTGRLFQVPSLRGVAWRPPFMHDGCAPTLAARFGDPKCTGGDRHGVTSNLTPAQISDLVAYLETL